MFGPDVVLDPRSAVFLIGGVVEAALGGAGEGVLSGSVHPRFIYNLNNQASSMLGQ